MNKSNISSSQKPHWHTPRIPVPSHYRIFRDCEWEVVKRSLSLLQASGFYWGALSVHEAHARLLPEPVGTYLLRDSSQGNCLFSLSVRMPSGPVSLRISFRKGYFWLKDWFSDCVVRLLELVVAGARAKPLHCDEMGEIPLVFSEPLRKEQNVPKLQELCQKALTPSSGIGPRSSSRTLQICWQGENDSVPVSGKNGQLLMMSIH